MEEQRSLLADWGNARVFGQMEDGTPVYLIKLSAPGISCEILTYGGTLRSLSVPNRAGELTDVVLGFDRLEDYLRQTQYMGAVVGRYANRIGGGAFILNGEKYTLARNEGVHHLHGGNRGFDRRVWTVKEVGEDNLTLALLSPHLEEGYPGNLLVEITYRLAGSRLILNYLGQTDRETVCSMTNHAYFNLNGQGVGSILNHGLQLQADYYTPAREDGIPTGEILPVDGTPMDLRSPRVLGEELAAPFEQIRLAGGYDRNWAVRGPSGLLRAAARVLSPETGISMKVNTTLPGIQVYTGNGLSGCPIGKAGAEYRAYGGLCLETQHFPDAPNRGYFPSAVITPSSPFAHTTQFRFSVEEDGEIR